MKTLATDCLIEAAQDPKLPYTAYLVEYVAPDGHTKYDIVMCIKPVSYTHLTLPTNREV